MYCSQVKLAVLLKESCLCICEYNINTTACTDGVTCLPCLLKTMGFFWFFKQLCGLITVINCFCFKIAPLGKKSLTWGLGMSPIIIIIRIIIIIIISCREISSIRMNELGLLTLTR